MVADSLGKYPGSDKDTPTLLQISASTWPARTNEGGKSMFKAVVIHLSGQHINWPFIGPFTSRLTDSSDTGHPDSEGGRPLSARQPLEIHAAAAQGPGQGFPITSPVSQRKQKQWALSSDEEFNIHIYQALKTGSCTVFSEQSTFIEQ